MSRACRSRCVDARDLRQLDLLDGIRPAEIEAGGKLTHIFAEAEHDAELVRVDANGEAKKAHQRRHHDRKQHRERPAHPSARYGLAEAVLAPAQNLFEVRLLARTRARAPRPSASALPAAASLIAPRHDELILRSE
jgi:hypothetical protein